tara:strand:- start:164 stop:388 length:225 start_codon:yes stop_codon:yes gene_type:complete
MAKDANRFYVDVSLEIYVPDQGCGEQAVKNENLDAEWFANEICSQIPKLVNEKWKYSERPYSVNWAYKGKVQRS